MKKIRVAINGFGRIGRITLRQMLKFKEIEVVAINDLTDAKTLCHLFKYDSVHRRFDGEAGFDPGSLVINGSPIPVFSETDPSELPWQKLGVDIVIESTGKMLTREKAGLHLKAGAGKVIISAPAEDEQHDIKYIVLGINDHILTPADRIVSNASCTTNNVAPLLKIIDELWGIEAGFITTVHSYTKDQNLLDGLHKDLRRARAAAYSIVPTTTGAAKAATRIFPHLEHKLGGAGIRVPVPDGSLTDLTCTVKNPADVFEVNQAFRHAAQTVFRGILEYMEDPVVSADIIGNTHSAVFDSGLTTVLGENNNLVKVVAWYDNEMGYATRLCELVVKLANL